MRQKTDSNKAYVKPTTRTIPLDCERMLAQSPAGVHKRNDYVTTDENPFG